jgi:hypothetical protein
MKIRHEINIINISVSGSSSSSAIVQLDTTQYVNPTYYFEVVANSLTGASNAKLNTVGGVTDSTITLDTSGTVLRQRSASFTPSASVVEYKVASSGISTNIRAARIIIIEDVTTLTSSEEQIEIGMNKTGLTSTTATKVPPDTTLTKYWLYTAANWDGTKTFYAEVTYLMASSKSSGTFVLQEDDGSFASWTDKITIVSAGVATVATRVRSTAFTPTTGRHYRIAYLVASSKSAASIFSAKIIVNQLGNFPTTNLLAYYKYSENTGSSVGDTSGNARTGTWNGTLGGQWTTGLIDTAGNFNGSNNYVNVPNFSNLIVGVNTLTLNVWAYSNNITSNGHMQIAGLRNGDTDDSFYINQLSNSGNLEFRFRNSSGVAGTIQVNSVMPLQTWTMFTLVYDGSTLYTYVNGVFKSSTAASGSFGNNSEPFRMGAGSVGAADNFFNGKIDEVGFWSSALPQSTITSLYKTGTGFQYTTATFTLLESQYLILNTADSGTGAQSYFQGVDITEWTGITTIYKHAIDSDNASNSAKLVSGIFDFTNTTVTGANQQISSAYNADEFGTTTTDVNVINSTGVIAASRIIVAATATSNTTTPQTITGVARITKVVPHTITGKGDILKATLKTITGISRIGLVTPQTITGTSRITKVVLQTVTGKADIAKTTSQTVTGRGRITTTVTKTITGTANITVPTPQTILGKSRITTTESQLITGKGRITVTSTQAITGKSRLQITTLQVVTGISRVTNVVPQLITGVSRITASTSQIITGKADILKATLKTVTGISRITNVIPQIVTGKADILKATSQTITGKGRITETLTQAVVGVSRIEVSVTKTVQGISRVQKSGTQDITGVSAIVSNDTTTTKNISGLSRIEVSTSQIVTGISRITNIVLKTVTGKSRITAATTKIIVGISRVEVSTTKIVQGVSRVQKSVTRTITGVAAIIIADTTETQNISGVSRITTIDSRTISGKARITTITPQTISGTADILKSTQKTLNGISRITTTTTKTVSGTSRITLITTKDMTGISNISKTTVKAITGKAQILSTIVAPESDIVFVDGKPALKIFKDFYIML